MSDAELVVLVPAGALVMALVVGYLLWRRRLRERFDDLESSLDLSHPDDEGFPRPLVGSWRGYRVEIRYSPGDGKTQPSELMFSLTPPEPIPVSGAIRVRRKNPFDRFAEWIGLVPRLWKARDPHAGKIYVEAENDRYAASLVDTEDFRRTVVPLTRYFRPWVSIDSGEVRLTLKGPLLGLIKNLRAVHVRTVLARLKTLAELDFPPAGEAGEFSEPASSPSMPRWVGYAAIGLMGAGVALYWWGSRFPAVTWAPIVYGSIIGAAGVVACAIGAFRALRGQSRALRPFAAILLIAVFVVPMGATGALQLVNGLLDSGVAERVDGRIGSVGDWWVRLEIAGGNPVARQSTEVRVPPSKISGSIRADAPVQIVLRPGALGFPWVASARTGPP